MLSDCFTIIRLEPGAELLDACSEIHETDFSIISIKLTHICMGDAHVSLQEEASLKMMALQFCFFLYEISQFFNGVRR